MSNFTDLVRNPTYESLTKTICVYLNRYDEDTLDAIPFFINCAEKNILRRLRAPFNTKMKKLEPQNFETLEDGYIFVPADYIEMENLWVEKPQYKQLRRVSWETMCGLKNGRKLVTDSAECGSDSFDSMLDELTPQYWTINGNRMYFYPAPKFTTKVDENGDEVPDFVQELFFTYYSDLPELSPYVKDESPLLVLMPDVMMYFALAEGFRFLMEPERAQQYEELAYRGMALVENQIELERQENNRFVAKFQ